MHRPIEFIEFTGVRLHTFHPASTTPTSTSAKKGMIMKTALRALAFIFAALFFSYAAYAQTGAPAAAPSPSPAAATTSGASSGAHERHGPCKEDVQKFCSNVQKGGHRVLDCLKEHEAQLSPRCEAGMKRHEANKQAAPSALPATTQSPPAATPAPAPTK